MTKQAVFTLLVSLMGLISSPLKGEILSEQFDLKKLEGKKLGYYIGSFDPIHLGHQHVIESALKEGHVDYVLVYPAPGGDSFKKRSPLFVRQALIASIYKEHPKVLLTQWSPKQLQDHFAPIQNRTQVIGIVGSDVITEQLMVPDLELREKYLKVFMRGLPIGEKHAEDTAGALMALKAVGFLVALRGEIDLSHLGQKVGERPILSFILSQDQSSTKIRAAIQENTPYEDLVAPSVQRIIEQEHLYQKSN